MLSTGCSVNMKSALTRRVFQQLLLDRPLAHSRCLRNTTRRNGFRLGPGGSRPFLTYLGFGKPKPQRELKPENVDPGMHIMVALARMLEQRERPPATPAIVEAFASFSKSRASRKNKMTDLQIELALTTFQHLRKTGSHNSSGLTPQVLFDVLRAVANKYSQGSGHDEKRVELARLAWKELIQMQEAFNSQVSGPGFDKAVPHLYFRVLSYNGRPTESLEFMLDFLRQTGNDTHAHNGSIWRCTLRAAARTGQHDDVEKVLAAMAANDMPYTEEDQAAIIEIFKESGDLQAVRKWYDQPIIQDTVRSKLTNAPRAAAAVFWMCLEHKDLDFAGRIISAIVNRSSDQVVKAKRDWKLIFAWAAANNKSVEEIKDMFDVMKRRCEANDIPWALKMPTFNALIRVAAIQNDSYRAERFLSLAYSLGCRPDPETYILMLDYRLKQGDLSGAKKAYKELQKLDIEDDEDVMCANNLILAMYQQQADVLDIMEIVADIIERKASFTPPVVAALCNIHLQRDELHDAIDLIRTHALQFGRSQRELLCDNILKFCLHTKTAARQTWDSYIILHELFSIETPREVREKIMEKLFTLGRPDMAVQVFGHMRKSPHSYRRPTAQSYRICFEGISADADNKEILSLVHNMLKLDHEVDPDTRVRNAMMLAYISAEDPETAIGIWEDIKASHEGPTYDSIRIAFWASETTPGGMATVKEIWQTLEEMKAEVTEQLYLSHAWALAGQGSFDEAFEMLEKMDDKFQSSSEPKPNPQALAIMFNATPLSERPAFSEMASERFSESWGEVRKLPHDNDIFERRYYKLDRGIRA